MRTSKPSFARDGSIPGGRRRRRWPLVTVLGAAVLALAILYAAGCRSTGHDPGTGLDTGSDPDLGTTETRAYSVWHWNVAGSAIHHGRTDTGLIENAARSITAERPDFVSFNEICQGQYEALVKRLAKAEGWTVPYAHARFTLTRAPGTGICEGGGFGNALLSSHELGPSKDYLLPKDYTPAEKTRLTAAGRGVEDRKMLCAPLRDQPRMKFCTVHITGSNRPMPSGGGGSAKKKINGLQLAEVGRVLDSFARNRQVYLVAGDFNAQPDLDQYTRLKPLMRKHTELDDANPAHCPGYGTWTALPPREVNGPPACGPHPKIDLILARGNLPDGTYSARAQNIPGDCEAVGRDDRIARPVTRVNCSDHRVLTGRATLRVPTG
ncbi:endonuclease/exonuclease/phosphatase family protein [Streptomyces sp. AP-93]|uniref:endonuclease/exonuclease/phosphatase family protein n=1 Tax=Streptomyces sp. AP-93 TaxID=2929048 RepID=UPI001FAEF67F|nr:endonuclease/exonuclease/phosphatase family protein [Streptomyces sp. AP-93]MCJ0873961.1 endonuclease/exonuclease/phosphatase family protein [Streptomyces sp. AP-93]